MKNIEKCLNLIKGAYDLHIHSTPSHIKRKIDDIELLEMVEKYQMAGVMIKNHYESTAGRAELLHKHFNFKTKVFGGVVLNRPVGGINPYAAESALKLGAKFVWLPTRDALHCLKYGNMEGDFFNREGITIFDSKGNLKNSFFELLEVIKKYNAVLATGHISIEESLAACQEATKLGIKTVLTHPDWKRTKFPLEIQKKISDMGVFIEKVWANLEEGDTNLEEFIESIKLIGPEKIFLTTDRGQYNREYPINCYLMFIDMLVENNFSDEEIKIMTSYNPCKLVK